MRKKEVESLVEVIDQEKRKMVVYDEESERNVVVTVQMQQEAWSEYQRLQDSVMQVAMSLARISERKLYLALGFNSFKDFYQNAGFSKSQTYRLSAIGRTFAPRMLQSGSESPNVGTPDNGKNSEQSSEREVPTLGLDLSDLGGYKLYELTRLSQESLDTLLNGGELFTPDGEAFTLKKAREMNTRDIVDYITRISRGKKQVSASQLKADVQFLKDEKKVLLNKIKEMEKDVKDARALEDHYGPAKAKMEDQIAKLKEAQAALGSFYRAMNRCGVDEDSPREVVDVFAALSGSIERYVEENQPLWWQIVQAAKKEV